MSDTACRWVSTTQPRMLPGRHDDGCENETCRGCQPCLKPHCRVCGVEHEVCCPGCRDEARTNLAEIQRMCAAMPDEARRCGVNSQAMSILAPVADPEAWGHHAASALAGRTIPLDCDARDLDGVQAWLDRADNETHPLWVLGTWEMVWRDALGHDSDDVVTIPGAATYLDLQLTYMAGYEHVPFEDFARDIRNCETRLRQIIHDQNDGDRANVGCFDCRGDLERKLGPAGFEDHWTCRKCRRRYTQTDYNLALRASIEGSMGTTA